MKGFLDKIDMGMRMFIIAIFGISVIYCILSGISKIFRKDSDIDEIDLENVQEYITIYSEETGEKNLDRSKLVKNYNTFYTIQSALKNYIDSLLDEKYSDTYGILSKEMINKYSKNDYIEKITKLVNENLLNDDGSYDSEYCLDRAYIIADMTYLCECKTLNDSLVEIGIRLDAVNQTYEVFYIDFNR